MTPQEYKKLLENGEIGSTEENKNNSQYEECVAKIVKASVEIGGQSKIKHKFLDADWAQNQLFLVLQMQIKFADDVVEKHIEVAPLMTREKKDKNGNPVARKVAIYGDIIDKITGQVLSPGTLLYDVLTKAREYSKEQSAKLENFTFRPELLDGLYFKIGQKSGISQSTNEFYIILETSRQKFRDEKRKQEYLANQNNGDVEIVEEKELPF